MILPDLILMAVRDEMEDCDLYRIAENAVDSLEVAATALGVKLQ